MSESQRNDRKISLADRFWDMYKLKGAGFAMLLLAAEFGFDDKRVQTSLPLIMKEAVARGIPMTQFLKEYEDATRVTDDGGGISSGSDIEAVRDEDAHDAGQARDADGQAEDATEECAAGKDV